MNRIESIIQEHLSVVENMLLENLREIEQLGELACKVVKGGKKILLMGNGGSSSDCQHIATELIVRFQNERRAIPAIALSSDSTVLTAIANDYSFKKVFSRQIEAFAEKGDMVIGISTSGESPNVIRGIEMAKRKGCYTVGILGKDGGKLNNMVDLAIVISSNNTARVQECHIIVGHIICELIDTEL